MSKKTWQYNNMDGSDLFFCGMSERLSSKAFSRIHQTRVVENPEAFTWMSSKLTQQIMSRKSLNGGTLVRSQMVISECPRSEAVPQLNKEGQTGIKLMLSDQQLVRSMFCATYLRIPPCL